MDRATLIAALQANAATKKLRQVTVPGLGTVFIRPATIGDTEEALASHSAGQANLLSRRVARMLCDAQGDPVLDANNPDDLALLSGQPEGVLAELSKAAAALDGTTAEAFDALGKA